MALSPVTLAIDVEPVLISTSAGVIGGVVTLPAARAHGAVVVLPGAGSTRAGLNRVWATLASSLAGVGVSSFRFDYPGVCESHLCRPDRWQEGTAEAMAWFRRRAGFEQVVLVAECGGLFPAYQEVLRRPGTVSAVGVVMPPVSPAGLRPRSRTLYRRARAAARRAQRLARRRADLTVGTQWPREVLAALGRSNDMLVEISARLPLWVLSAAQDPATAELSGLHGRLAAGVDFELELAGPGPGERLPGELEVVACTTGWVCRHLGLEPPPGAARGGPGPEPGGHGGDR